MEALPYRPFELVKLIRDGKIRTVRELFRLRLGTRHRMHLVEFESALVDLGIMDVAPDGTLRTTECWDRLARALRLSLAQLSSYDEDSVVCAPTFGRPGKPAVEAEVLVLMPFVVEMRPIYQDHIKRVAQELHLKVARADDFFTADSVVRDIWNAISACRVIVADCTGRNPNVFYEIGMAHTLGKPVLLITQTAADIPFNLGHFRVIIYDFNPRGMREFEQTLKATLKHELRAARNIEDLLASIPGATVD